METPEGKRCYFITDAHLGSLAFPSRENEKRLVAFLERIRPHCAGLYILGDMMDFWFEYPRVVPKGFVRFFAAVASFTDQGIPVYWFVGNHDMWTFSYLEEELGVTVYYQPKEIDLMGRRFFIAHGDTLGEIPWLTRFLNVFFRGRFSHVLFRHILPPHWGVGFGRWWARHSFEKRKRNGGAGYFGEERENLVRFAKADAAAKGNEAPDFYVFGHRHIVLDLQLACGSRVLMLGDWIQEFSYGVFDGEQFELLNDEAGE